MADQPQYTIRTDEVGAPATTYVGEAYTGSAEAAAVWRIKRITVAAGITTVLFADGNQSFDNIWTNRAALAYS